MLNDQRELVFANRAFFDGLGRSWGIGAVGASPLGQPLGDALGCIKAAEGCGHSASCSACGALSTINAAIERRETAEGEYQLTRADSYESLDLRVRATPMTLFDEELVVLAISDIRHERRRRALERIFFHDVLNTAGALRGMAHLLVELPPEQNHEFRHSVVFLADKLIDEIKAQRTLASAENLELKLELGAVHSVELLQEVAVTYRNYERTRKVRIVVDPDADDVAFVTDGTILRRILGNMVKNALEASGEGDTATIGCRTVGHELEFWVHNPAVMPPAVRHQVFHRSFSTKGTGRGLGTYSMKLLSERYLEGRVTFTSEEDEGTTFRARYPLKFGESGPSDTSEQRR